MHESKRREGRAGQSPEAEERGREANAEREIEGWVREKIY